VPSCDACHGSDGTGMAPMAVPPLAGQHAAYIQKELKLFATGKRTNSPGHVMAMIAKRLTPKQIKDVSLYAQALHPDLVPGRGPKTYQAYVKSLASQPVPGIPESAMKSSETASASARK
ncbi:MAG TPA: c-type cytochrome, partial [Gammaproteobacteria bacterium]|nr:c-type cytochrome [Gammaproteobacteria bacterium]